MFDKKISASEVAAGPFPFVHEGEITLAARNGDYSPEQRRRYGENEGLGGPAVDHQDCLLLALAR
jgi:hypothetical protein